MHRERLVLQRDERVELDERVQHHQQHAAEQRRTQLRQDHAEERPARVQPQRARGLLERRVHAAQRHRHQQEHDRRVGERDDPRRAQEPLQDRADARPRIARHEQRHRQRRHRQQRPHPPARQVGALDEPRRAHAEDTRQRRRDQCHQHRVQQQRPRRGRVDRLRDSRHAALQALDDRHADRQRHDDHHQHARQQQRPRRAAAQPAPPVRPRVRSGARGGDQRCARHDPVTMCPPARAAGGAPAPTAQRSVDERPRCCRPRRSGRRCYRRPCRPRSAPGGSPSSTIPVPISLQPGLSIRFSRGFRFFRRRRRRLGFGARRARAAAAGHPQRDQDEAERHPSAPPAAGAPLRRCVEHETSVWCGCDRVEADRPGFLRHALRRHRRRNLPPGRRPALAPAVTRPCRRRSRGPAAGGHAARGRRSWRPAST